MLKHEKSKIPNVTNLIYHCTTGTSETKQDPVDLSLVQIISLFPISFFFFNFYFYFILLYNTVLVLPYIDMNLPRVYMSSQS